MVACTKPVTAPWCARGWSATRLWVLMWLGLHLHGCSHAYNYTRAIDITAPSYMGDEWDTSQHEVYTIRMPGAHPKKDDDYQHYQQSFDIKERSYITSFTPAVEEVCHHVILSFSKQGHHNEIIWAWANHGSSLTLPKPVAYVVEPGDSWQMTMHYKRAQAEADFSGINMTIMTETQLQAMGKAIPAIYPAKVVLLAATAMKKYDDQGILPKDPRQKGIREFQRTEYVAHAVHTHSHKQNSYIFAYRTHAHLMGTLIEGFRHHGHETTKIASRSPQQAQTFVRFEAEGTTRRWTIQKGDELEAFCYYDEFRHFGQEFTKEMCNLYLMMYSIPSEA